jgi:aminotransferase
MPLSSTEPAHRLDDDRLSERVHAFPESVIREMTRLAIRHGALNLAQGFPDWDPPREAIEAAQRAMDQGHNQYAVTWGAPELREAIAAYATDRWSIPTDADRNVTVTCGATEAMMAAMLALVDPGDEVVLFEPFYENSGPDAALSGATLRHVPLYPDRDYAFDEEELKAAFTSKTKAVILNSPNNPSGKVFTRDELRAVADLCVDHDAIAVTDEIYDFLTYDGHEHVPIATLDGMADRTITIQGASKVYSMTGWRVAWLLADHVLTQALRRVHDFLTVGAAHPLQIGVAKALTLPESYYTHLRARYDRQRKLLAGSLERAGFDFLTPQGAYYILADFSDVDAPKAAKADDRAFARWLVEGPGVAAVPGSSFFRRADLGRSLIRVHFAKSESVLRDAGERLERVATTTA